MARGVVLPASWNSLARVYLDAGSSPILPVASKGVVFVAWRYGRGPSIVAAVLGVAVFDFFFCPAVSDLRACSVDCAACTWLSAPRRRATAGASPSRAGRSRHCTLIAA